MTQKNKVCNSAYKTHMSNFGTKPTTEQKFEEKKSSMAKIGDIRMREKPYERIGSLEGRKFSHYTPTDSDIKIYRVSRVRDISALALGSGIK
jgi:hypothetical protein